MPTSLINVTYWAGEPLWSFTSLVTIFICVEMVRAHFAQKSHWEVERKNETWSTAPEVGSSSSLYNYKVIALTLPAKDCSSLSLCFRGPLFTSTDSWQSQRGAGKAWASEVVHKWWIKMAASLPEVQTYGRELPFWGWPDSGFCGVFHDDKGQRTGMGNVLDRRQRTIRGGKLLHSCWQS